MQAGARPLRTHCDQASRRGGRGGSGRWGTHACLRSMTPCQNIKCMLWLLSQMRVRFFKSIDSGWINGNRGIYIFFSLCKKGVRTLCREAPARGGKSKCSARTAFFSTGHQRAPGGRSRCCLGFPSAPYRPTMETPTSWGVRVSSCAPPGGEVPSLPPALTQSSSKDNSTPSPMSKQVRPAVPSKHSQDPPSLRLRCLHLVHLSPGPWPPPASHQAARRPPSGPEISRCHMNLPHILPTDLPSYHSSACSRTPSESPSPLPHLLAPCASHPSLPHPCMTPF